MFLRALCSASAPLKRCSGHVDEVLHRHSGVLSVCCSIWILCWGAVSISLQTTATERRHPYALSVTLPCHVVRSAFSAFLMFDFFRLPRVHPTSVAFMYILVKLAANGPGLLGAALDSA